MIKNWTFNREPREEWPAWLQTLRVGTFHTPGGDGRPEHLRIHDSADHQTVVLPGQTISYDGVRVKVVAQQ